MVDEQIARNLLCMRIRKPQYQPKEQQTLKTWPLRPGGKKIQIMNVHRHLKQEWAFIVMYYIKEIMLGENIISKNHYNHRKLECKNRKVWKSSPIPYSQQEHPIPKCIKIKYLKLNQLRLHHPPWSLSGIPSLEAVQTMSLVVSPHTVANPAFEMLILTLHSSCSGPQCRL